MTAITHEIAIPKSRLEACSLIVRGGDPISRERYADRLLGDVSYNRLWADGNGRRSIELTVRDEQHLGITR